LGGWSGGGEMVGRSDWLAELIVGDDVQKVLAKMFVFVTNRKETERDPDPVSKIDRYKVFLP